MIELFTRTKNHGYLVAIDYLLCSCGHRQFRHYQHTGLCDGDGDMCVCKEFTIDLSLTADHAKESDPVTDTDKASPMVSPSKLNSAARIVGIQSHEFVGENELCKGILGFSVTSDRYDEVCNKPRQAEIHRKTSNSGLKDSGQRLNFASGMVRDIDDTKPAFDLLIPLGIPYDKLMITRWAELLRKGAIKYAKRNWELADSDEELDRAKASAFRHFMQWFSGETDEDHAAAVFFNINEVETIRYKQANQKKED